MLSKTLQESADYHDSRSKQDGESSSIFLIQVGGDRDGNNRTKLIASRHETNYSGLDTRLSILSYVALTEI